MARADNVNRLDENFINIAGAGKEGSHVIIDASNPYTAEDNEYVYLIDIYTADAKFDSLKERDSDVDSARLDAGGDGYPAGTFIPGRFSYIKPDSSSTVAGLIMKS